MAYRLRADGSGTKKTVHASLEPSADAQCAPEVLRSRIPSRLNPHREWDTTPRPHGGSLAGPSVLNRATAEYGLAMALAATVWRPAAGSRRPTRGDRLTLGEPVVARVGSWSNVCPTGSRLAAFSLVGAPGFERLSAVSFFQSSQQTLR
jgi:hypothetical protein